MAKVKNKRQQRIERRVERRQGNLITLRHEEPQHIAEEPKILERFIPLKEAQVHYDNLIRSKDLVIVTGAAGTGKTHCPVAHAAIGLRERKIKKVIITRPILESMGGGKGLGFLPGTQEDKQAPYFAPILEIMRKYMRKGELDYHLSHEAIKFVPFELMRGHTFEDAFVIGDELQNATAEQMELLLTRMGRGSKYVLSGDTRQKDLTSKFKSGLFDAVERFKDFSEVGHMHFEIEDIVRHHLVKKFVKSYYED